MRMKIMINDKTMTTKRQLREQLQSLTERVERLEAKAELFDKGLEVCVDAHKESLRQIWELKGYPKADKPASQTALKKEADLFNEPAEEDVWIDSKEACLALGWKSISTTMLRKAGIRYQQPQGKHRKITAHKGDIENYVRNRRDGRK